MAPPYVLDLIWHAHQSNPVAYKKDCLYYVGKELPHHPWPNGLGELTELAPEFHCAWKTGFWVDAGGRLETVPALWRQRQRVILNNVIGGKLQ